MTDIDFEQQGSLEGFVNALSELGARAYFGDKGSNAVKAAVVFGKTKSGKVTIKQIKQKNDRQGL